MRLAGNPLRGGLRHVDGARDGRRHVDGEDVLVTLGGKLSVRGDKLVHRRGVRHEASVAGREGGVGRFVIEVGELPGARTGGVDMQRHGRDPQSSEHLGREVASAVADDRIGLLG